MGGGRDRGRFCKERIDLSLQGQEYLNMQKLGRRASHVDGRWDTEKSQGIYNGERERHKR